MAYTGSRQQGSSTGNWKGAPSGSGSSSSGRNDVGGRGSTRTSGPPTRSPQTRGPNADANNQQSAAVKDARQVAKERSLSDDARRGGVRSIEVGPQRQPVQIGTGKISQAVNSVPQQSADQLLRSLGQKYNLPRSKSAAESWSPAYSEQNIRKQGEISSRIPSLDERAADLLRNTFYGDTREDINRVGGIMDLAMMSPARVPFSAYSAGRSIGENNYVNAAINAADAITGLPATRVAMFLGPGASPSLRAAYEKGRSLYSRGAGNEAIFHETGNMTGYGISGLQNVPDSRYWGFEVSAPMNIKESVFPSGGFLSSGENTVFGKMIREPTNLGSVAEMGSLSGMYGGKLSDITVKPSFSPYEMGFYGKEGRSFYGQYSPWSNTIDMNTPFSKGFITRGLYGPDQFRKTLAHETQHAVGNLDYFVPQGYNPQTFKSKFVDAGVPVDPKYLENAANFAYVGDKGETLARLTQNRLDVPAQQMKDWGTRITAPSDEWFRTFEADEVVRNAEDYIRNEIARRQREESLRRGQPSGWDAITLD